MGTRVALVLHGHFRNFDNLWNEWKLNFIDPIKPDVFGFAWGDSMGNHVAPHHSYDNRNHPGFDTTSPDVPTDFIDTVRSRLNPKSLIVEHYSDYREKFHNIINDPKNAKGFHSDVSQRPHGVLGMVLSRDKAIKAKADYEKANGFVYDLVVVTRWDVGYNNLISLTDGIDPNIINAVGSPHNRPWDWWTVGPSHLIDNWGEQFANLDKMVELDKFVCEPHLWQKAWFEYRNIPWRGIHNGIYISRLGTRY